MEIYLMTIKRTRQGLKTGCWIVQPKSTYIVGKGEIKNDKNRGNTINKNGA